MTRMICPLASDARGEVRCKEEGCALWVKLENNKTGGCARGCAVAFGAVSITGYTLTVNPGDGGQEGGGER